MTDGSKKHPCRKVVLGELDRRIAKVLNSLELEEEFISLVELNRLINDDGAEKVQKPQLKKRLSSLAREGFVKLHKKDSSNPSVGKGQFFVNFLFED